MFSLRDYYLDNVKKDSRYFEFYDDINNGVYASPFDDDVKTPEVVIYEAEDAIDKFKMLIQPSNGYSLIEELEFILVCFYLNDLGYYIRQFPEILKRPQALEKFAYEDIRSYLIAKDRHEGGTVRWSERRVLINELEFKKGNLIKGGFSKEIDEKFKLISTRGASFDNMSNQEKLKEISNFFEHLLKKENGYKEIDENDFLKLINNKDLIAYRKILNCYRHSSEKSITEREQLIDKESFLIYYGIAIINGLNKEIMTIRKD